MDVDGKKKHSEKKQPEKGEKGEPEKGEPEKKELEKEEPEKKEPEKKELKFSSSALKIIDNASRCAVSKGNELEQLSEEVGQMGILKLFWDSKVPQNKKGWISFKVSDPEAIKEEIEKYQNFYALMRTAMHSIRNGERGGIENVEEIIDDLYEELDQMAKAAESGEESTDSKTLCKLHQKFISKHDKLENIIRRVESVGLRQKQKHLTEKLEKSLKAVESLTKELTEAQRDKDDMKTYLEEIKEENQKSRSERAQILEENKQILKLLENLVNKK